jgi:hypothetical protein
MRSKPPASSTDPFAVFGSAPEPEIFRQQHPAGSDAARKLEVFNPQNLAADPKFRPFAVEGQPVERFHESAPAQSLDEITARAQREAQRSMFSPIGTVVLIFLNNRKIDFSKDGPTIGYNAAGRLQIQTPVERLPEKLIYKDARGNVYEDLEFMPKERRRRLLKSAKHVKTKQRFEDYASGVWNGNLVIGPLTGMLVFTLSQTHPTGSVQFFQDERGQYPALLYDPKTRRLEIVGGGGQIIR